VQALRGKNKSKYIFFSHFCFVIFVQEIHSGIVLLAAGKTGGLFREIQYHAET